MNHPEREHLCLEMQIIPEWTPAHMEDLMMTIGKKKHTFLNYDQFVLNTGWFWGNNHYKYFAFPFIVVKIRIILVLLNKMIPGCQYYSFIGSLHWSKKAKNNELKPPKMSLMYPLMLPQHWIVINFRKLLLIQELKPFSKRYTKYMANNFLV